MKTHRLSTTVLALLVASCWPASAWAADYAAKPAATPSALAAKPADSIKTNSSGSASSTNYHLRALDSITVNVIDDPKALTNCKISSDGTVELPYLDNDKPIKVAGLTIGEAIAAITKAYVDQKIFVKPTVTLMVTEYAERHVNLIGNFNKPGPVTIPPQKDFTLVEAVSEAGGPTRSAAEYVTITRKHADGSTEKLENVDLLHAMHDANQDIPLQEGDTISIGQSLVGNVYD